MRGRDWLHLTRMLPSAWRLLQDRNKRLHEPPKDPLSITVCELSAFAIACSELLLDNHALPSTLRNRIRALVHGPVERFEDPVGSPEHKQMVRNAYGSIREFVDAANELYTLVNLDKRYIVECVKEVIFHLRYVDPQPPECK